tara:strand:+ start:76 stop:855 length:780 start_codon:yes stop_codon:yes gene_type:complete
MLPLIYRCLDWFTIPTLIDTGSSPQMEMNRPPDGWSGLTTSNRNMVGIFDIRLGWRQVGYRVAAFPKWESKTEDRTWGNCHMLIRAGLLGKWRSVTTRERRHINLLALRASHTRPAIQSFHDYPSDTSDDLPMVDQMEAGPEVYAAIGADFAPAMTSTGFSSSYGFVLREVEGQTAPKIRWDDWIDVPQYLRVELIRTCGTDAWRNTGDEWKVTMEGGVIVYVSPFIQEEVAQIIHDTNPLNHKPTIARRIRTRTDEHR